MNFLLSDTQREIQEAVRRLLAERCDSAQLHRLFDGDSGFDPALWQALAAMGVAGLHLPERFGGTGLEMIDLAIVAEVLGAAAAPLPFLDHSLAAFAILLAGSEEQQARWLPRLTSGELIGSVACAEGEQRWQPSEWTLPAAERLTGSKAFVGFAAQAGLFVVGTRGGGLAVVEAGAPGLSIIPTEGVDRTRRFATLQFEATPAEVLPGGAAQAERLRDAALVLLAADAFGGASRCVDMAMAYAKLREQYGAPIGQFQGLKHQLVNMAVDIEPARGLYWFAAHAFDYVPEQAARAAALAKAHLSDRFLQAARDTVEAHGGIGYTWEYDVQIYFKRAMFDYASYGAPALHRARCAELAGW
jgi:alkylation response protein AidB-like acyl-CoA dehydrogenase